MSAPQRIQRRRAAGWKMPANTRYVGRGSIFGNPFKVAYDPEHGWQLSDPANLVQRMRDAGVWYPPTGHTQQVREALLAKAVELYELHTGAMGSYEYDDEMLTKIGHLAGMNLACWCPADAPCHADVLLREANRPEAARG